MIASPTSTTVFDTATGETTVDSENEDNAPSDESEGDDQRILGMTKSKSQNLRFPLSKIKYVFFSHGSET